MILLLVGCSKGKVNIPDLTDEPLTAPVAVKDLPETVPAYGIASAGAFEVNLEAEDGPLVRAGQRAVVRSQDSPKLIECRVTAVIQNVNLATGQAVAWMRAVKGSGLSPGSFVSAEVVIGVKHKVLTVPQESIYIRDGKTLVLLKRADKGGGVSYDPMPVETGVTSDTDVEIVSGLKAGEEVATRAGIGYLYTDFKANVGD